MDKNDNSEQKLPGNAKDIVLVENAEYRTHYSNKYKNKKKYVPNNPKYVIAFMPGTIVDVFVKSGSKVKKGDSMLVLEAMKMKNLIFAEMSGTVKKVHVKVGDRIPKQQLLVEMK